MEEFTAGDVRARTFRVAMRGFDKGEVGGYLEQLAGYLEAVQQQLHQVGIAELSSPRDLAAEYVALGDEVARVLEEARSAADAMRSRATADTARWRADAAAESEKLRQSAWEAGTEMLDQVIAQTDALVAEAQETAHRLRSEAERQSAGLLTDAQREREELTRAGRDEAEKTVTAARKEADSLVMASRHQAEVAQERAKALEDRRAELMDELESAQKALLGIEEESVEEEAAEASEDPTPKGPTPGESRWAEDGAGVRVVAARRDVVAEPVDADALAAEVEAMRVGPGSPPAGGRNPTTPSASLSAAPPPTGEETEQPDSEKQTKLGPEPGPETAPEREPGPEIGAETEPGPDPLAGLFDELRTPEEAVSESPNGQPQPQEQGATVVVLTEKASETAEEADDSRLATRDSTDPFALRDRLLLPVQNQALRLIKRQLVSAQNQALEELRLDAEWSPGPNLLNGEIGGALVELVEASVAAGVGAAAELLGSAEAAEPAVHVEDPSAEFSGAFVDAVSLSLERSRSAGAGKRETSSSLSRVFRAWRTDDAERRVRMRSRAAYHLGLLGSFRAMGCDRVAVALFDRSCLDHGDALAPWPIADGPPPGVLIPPASLECSCTVVPDC